MLLEIRNEAENKMQEHMPTWCAKHLRCSLEIVDTYSVAQSYAMAYAEIGRWVYRIRYLV